MHKILCPRIPHKLYDLEKLPEMQILLICHNIETLVEIICLFAVDGRGYVPRCIYAGAVLFKYYAGGHIVLVQHYHLCPVAFRKQPLVLQLLHHGLPLVLIEALPRIGVKAHPQKVVNAGHVPKGYILEPVEYLHGLGVVVLHLLEPRPRLLLHGLVRFVVKAHIQPHQLVYAALFYVLAAAPHFIGAYELSELRAPVPQMVYPHAFIAQKGIYLIQRIA